MSGNIRTSDIYFRVCSSLHETGLHELLFSNENNGEVFVFPGLTYEKSIKTSVFTSADSRGNVVSGLVAASTGLRGFPLAMYLSQDFHAQDVLTALLDSWHKELVSNGIHRINYVCNSQRMLESAEACGYVFEEDVRVAFYRDSESAMDMISYNEKVEIRSAGEDDISSMLHLWDIAPGVTVEPWQKLIMPEFIKNNSEIVLNAFVGDSLIGSVVGAQTGPFGVINHLVVHPAARGEGLGKQLVYECICRMKERSASVIWMTYRVTPERERFWESAGFESQDGLLLGNLRIKD